MDIVQISGRIDRAIQECEKDFPSFDRVKVQQSSSKSRLQVSNVIHLLLLPGGADSLLYELFEVHLVEHLGSRLR